MKFVGKDVSGWWWEAWIDRDSCGNMQQLTPWNYPASYQCQSMEIPYLIQGNVLCPTLPCLIQFVFDARSRHGTFTEGMRLLTSWMILECLESQWETGDELPRYLYRGTLQGVSRVFVPD